MDTHSKTPLGLRTLGTAALMTISACQAVDEPLDPMTDTSLDERADQEDSPEPEALERLETEEALLRAATDEDAKDLMVWQQQGLTSTGPVEFLAADLDLALRGDETLDEPIEIDVFLDEGTRPLDEPRSSGSVEVDADGRQVELTLDGQPASEGELEAQQDRLAGVLRDAEALRRADNRTRWESLAARYGLSEELRAAARSGASSAVLTVPGRVVRQIEQEREAVPVRRIAVHRDVEGSDGMTSALASMEISTHALPYGWNGSGIGVWMNDGNGRPITSTDCIDNNDLIVQSFGSEPDEDHATLTLCTLQAAAPLAKVHYGVPTQACNLRSDVTTFSNPPVYVSSQSNAYGDNDDDYDNCARDWDNFVYDTRIAHFALTHNQDSFVRGAAKAYNVFSIGAYDDATDAMASFSNWGDPETGAHKPEFVAPGVGVSVDPFGSPSGTSISTPLAAGFAADLLERHPFLRLQPALLKAYLLVNSVRVDGSSVFGPKDGAGRLDFSNVAWGKAWWWNGANHEWFTQDTDTDGRLERVVTYTFYAGYTYHVAASWLVDGDYVRSHNEPNMDIDLQVKAPNGNVWGSYTVDNSHEIVSFTAPVTGVYTIKSERYWNSGQGNVSMGLVVRGF